MCDDVVRRDPYSLLGVPDFSVTSQQIKIWRDSDYLDDEDVIRWYNRYQNERPRNHTKQLLHARRREKVINKLWK